MSFIKTIKRYSTVPLNWLARKANSRSLKIATLAGAATVVGGATFNVIKALNDDAEPEIENLALVLTGASYFLFTYLTGLMTNVATYQEMQNKVHELEIDKNVLPSGLALTTFEALQILSIGSISIFPWVAAGKGFDKKQSAATASQVISLSVATLLRVSERFWFDDASKKTKHAIEQVERQRYAEIQARNTSNSILEKISNFNSQYEMEGSSLSKAHHQSFRSGSIHCWIYSGLTFEDFVGLSMEQINLLSFKGIAKILRSGILTKEQALQIKMFQIAIFENGDITSWLNTLDINNGRDIINIIIGSSENQRPYEILSDINNREQISLNSNNFKNLLEEASIESNNVPLERSDSVTVGPSSSRVP